MSKKTSISEEDIKWTLEKFKLVKFQNGFPIMCCDEKYLNEIYKKVGRPGLRVVTDNIHFTPFKTKWEIPHLFL